MSPMQPWDALALPQVGAVPAVRLGTAAVVVLLFVPFLQIRQSSLYQELQAACTGEIEADSSPRKQTYAEHIIGSTCFSRPRCAADIMAQICGCRRTCLLGGRRAVCRQGKLCQLFESLVEVSLARIQNTSDDLHNKQHVSGAHQAFFTGIHTHHRHAKARHGMEKRFDGILVAESDRDDCWASKFVPSRPCQETESEACSSPPRSAQIHKCQGRRICCAFREGCSSLSLR